MRAENMSFDAYKIVVRLKQGNIVHHCDTLGVQEVLGAGLAVIDARNRLAITSKGRAVPRVLRRAA